MIYLLNFANENFLQAQKLNTKTGLSIGECDYVFECNPALIDLEFATLNTGILQSPRGAGYWLWKPYFIRKTLMNLKDGEVLIYSDSGSFFRKSAKPLASLPDAFNQDIIPFELELYESAWTKRDAFVYMDCEGRGYELTLQRLASFIVVKKTKLSLHFFDQYIKYCCDERVLTDLENTSGLNNFPDFIDHRHDQSVFSLLSKKFEFQAFRDPSQFGMTRIKNYTNSDYGQIFEHTRDKNPERRGFFSKLKTIFIA